jgi:hypothetical protein
LFSHLFVFESDSSPFIYNFLDFSLRGGSEEAMVFVQVVLMRIWTFQGAKEAIRAAISFESALTRLRKTLSGSFDVEHGEVVSLISIETIFQENLQKHIFYFCLFLSLIFAQLFFNNIFLQSSELLSEFCIEPRVFQIFRLRSLAEFINLQNGFLVLGLRSLDNFGNLRILFN